MIGLFRTRQRRDPIIGSQDGTLDFKVPKRPIRKTIKGLPAFTTVRGGAYFFPAGHRALSLSRRTGGSLTCRPGPAATVQSGTCTQPRNVDEREMTDVIIIGAGPAGVVARRAPSWGPVPHW